MVCSTPEANSQLLNSDIVLIETISDRNPRTFCPLDQDYIEKINEVQAYIQKVKTIVGPGCPKEVLNVAVNLMSSLVQTLSDISSTPKLHSSL